MKRDTGDSELSAEPRTVSFSSSDEKAPASDAGPEPGTVIDDKYRVERLLGAGGMGVVVAATHVELGEQVALKLLRCNAEGSALARFRREARIALRLKGENVARVMDIGRLPTGQPYLVMDYLEGESTAHRLKREGRLAAADAVAIVLDACMGIAEAHRLGVVHRDIKPSNLYITRRADGTRLVKVLDFGIAKLRELDPTSTLSSGASTELTAASVVLGSPSYMSPEQVRSARDVDERADVWSLGVVLYELVSGALPFPGASPSGIMAAIVADAPRPLDGKVAPEIARVIARCLEKKPRARFANVAELARALAPSSPGGVEAAERISRTLAVREEVHPSHEERDEAPTASPWQLPSGEGALQRRRGTYLAIGAVLVIAAVAIAWPGVHGAADLAPRLASAGGPLVRGSSPSTAMEPTAVDPAPAEPTAPEPSAVTAPARSDGHAHRAAAPASASASAAPALDEEAATATRK